MINKKKEGGFYASKVRLFLNEYDGIPLEEFCKAEKVSYNKMLNCLGRTNHQYHPVNKPKGSRDPRPGKRQVKQTFQVMSGVELIRTNSCKRAEP